MYRFSANSRATISSTAIFLSRQSRQYFSSPRGSDTSLAPHSAHRDLATDLRGIAPIYNLQVTMSKERQCRESGNAQRAATSKEGLHCHLSIVNCRERPASAGAYMRSTYSLTMRRAENRGATVRIASFTS